MRQQMIVADFVECRELRPLALEAIKEMEV
ncbi:hypothetical protein LCGC14_1467100 [marine sediment metagenome]|uniref:Uncharacterized protein n=1 Tax=marine sediment metagenome TaxID=412755 RepID=A0A0F9JZG5_9ZZZZ